MGSSLKHDATAVALAFRYQERRALFDLWETQNDDASVAVEALDDIQVNQPGLTLIEQVKHSLQPIQPAITLKSSALWKTLRIWCELLPCIDLKVNRFVFICTSPIDDHSSLNSLRTDGSDRTQLLDDLDEEAKRVSADTRRPAAVNSPQPYNQKKKGIEAWSKLTQSVKHDLLDRVVLKPDAPNVYEQEDHLAAKLTSYPKAQRQKLANRLLGWWDGEVLRSMQEKRAKYISYSEVVAQLSHLNAMLEKDEFFETFSSQQPPAIYRADEMLAKQCALVNATNTMIDRARIFEWQARGQRAVWSDESPTKSKRLARYDETLVNEWKAQHDEAVEASDEDNDTSMIEEGQKVLKWASRCNSTEVGNIDNYSTPPFYIRGSYQTLSIEGRVGWHPLYKSLLGFDA